MNKLYFLAIDDASFIRDLIKRTLRSTFSGCQIDEAIDGKKGQTLMAKNQYDLILCDWEMPEMSGLELLSWFRDFEKKEGLEKTPFIMVTSRGDKEHVVQAVQAGVNDYIGKPFNNDQLLKKVFKALARKHKSMIQGILSGQSQGSGSQGGFADSSALLGAKPAEQKPKVKAAPEAPASLLTANSASEKLLTETPSHKARVKSGNKGKCRIRVASGISKGIIKDINLTQVLVQVPREELSAQLFQQAVVDIDLPEDEKKMVQLNSFVIATAAADKTLNSEHILITLKYADDDPEKMEALSKFIAQVR